MFYSGAEKLHTPNLYLQNRNIPHQFHRSSFVACHWFHPNQYLRFTHCCQPTYGRHKAFISCRMPIIVRTKHSTLIHPLPLKIQSAKIESTPRRICLWVFLPLAGDSVLSQSIIGIMAKLLLTEQRRRSHFQCVTKPGIYVWYQRFSPAIFHTHRIQPTKPGTTVCILFLSIQTTPLLIQSLVQKLFLTTESNFSFNSNLKKWRKAKNLEHSVQLYYGFCWELVTDPKLLQTCVRNRRLYT